MKLVEKLLKDAFGERRVKVDEAMANHTSVRTGGRADYYIEVENRTDLFKAIVIASDENIPFTILGSGTSILIGDTRLPGVVIKNNCRKFELMSMTGKVRGKSIDVDKAYVYAESGALINQVVRYVIEQGYAGLEYALGLPGTVGGALYTNASYQPAGFSIGDIVHKATILKPTGEIADVTADYFHFRPGKSNISETGDIVLSVLFALRPSQQALLWQKGEEALRFRTAWEKEGVYPSTYRMISISETQAALAGGGLPDVPYLLSHSKLAGKMEGDVMLSKDNPYVIINCGTGRTADIIDLLTRIKKQIKTQYTVDLDIQMKQIGV